MAETSATKVSIANAMLKESISKLSRENLIKTTVQLFDSLSDEQKIMHMKQINTALLSSSSNNSRGDDQNMVHRKKKRIRTGNDADPNHYNEKIISTSVVINYVLPYLDHDTWKSVSILSKEIYNTVHRLKMYPPWPTRKINVKSNRKNSFKGKEHYDLSFDYTTGTSLAVLNESTGFGSIFDSRCGLIKSIDFSLIRIKEQAARVSKIQMLDRKTFFVMLAMGTTDEDMHHGCIVYLYRIVEDGPSHRKVFGLDMIRYGAIMNGPWLFKRNGAVYVATAHGLINPEDPFGNRISTSIVINQYLGESAWPNCLKETHRLQYDEIDFLEEDDEEEPDMLAKQEFQYICQPRENLKEMTSDEKIVLVSITDYDNRHIHCWRVDFQHQKFGDDTSTGTSGEGGINDGIGVIVPCLSYGTIPWFELSVDIDGNSPSLKIVPLPNGANNNYLFRIIEYFPQWWHGYAEEMGSYSPYITEFHPEEHARNQELLAKYSEENIFVWDYNIETNKFENTSSLSLANRDGSAVRYRHLIVVEDGLHFLSVSDSEDVGICRIDLNSSIVQNYTSISGSNSKGHYDENIGLSNDNSLIAIPQIGYGYRPDVIHINYLYLKSPTSFTIDLNKMKEFMKTWLSR